MSLALFLARYPQVLAYPVGGLCAVLHAYDRRPLQPDADLLWDLFHLTDYAVSSVQSSVAWLREKHRPL